MLQHSRYCGGKRIKEHKLLGMKIYVWRSNTDSRSEDLLQDCDELMIDVDGQIAEYLSVFGQIKVPQAVLLLPGGALFQEFLA